MRALVTADSGLIGRLNRWAPVGVSVLAAVSVSAWIASRAPLGLDYPTYDAGPSIRALIEGDLDAFLKRQPLMGIFSLLLRAPFAALARFGDGSELLVYRLGAFPCLLAASLLGVGLFHLMGQRGQNLPSRVVVAGVCVLNPMTFNALAAGHPEELLAGAMCVGAVLLAIRGRAASAAVVLGLALATKQWTVVAFLPVLIAAPVHRVRVAVGAVLIAAVLWAPYVIADSTRFVAVTKSTLTVGANIPPTNVWWPLTTRTERTVFDGVEYVRVPIYSLPPALYGVTHPLIVLLPIPLSYLYWRRRRFRLPEDALGLLALLFLLRCALDPVNTGYYHVPLILALAGWEGMRRKGLPLVTMLTALALWLTYTQVAPPNMGPAVAYAFYLAWTVPLAVLLGVLVLGGERRARTEKRRA